MIPPMPHIEIEKMVAATTEFGIHIVQSIAAETLKHKPGMSLQQFTKVLDEYITKTKTQG